MNKTELLNKFAKDPEERILLARVLDKAEQTRTRSVPAHTGFLSPAQQAAVSDLLKAAGHLEYLFFGGYAGAERAVCAFLPDWQSDTGWLAGENKPVAALRCTFPKNSGLTHRDFLGGLMGIGITREKIGDILVGDGTCDLVVLSGALPIVLDQFSTAGRFRLQTAPLSLDALKAVEIPVKTVRDTVATLRLDAVLSAGFSIARSKAAGLIQTGKVAVNHRECLKPDRLVAEGDTLTCRGMGKCILKSVLGQSKKGRIMIEMERWQ